jgi:pimeloyl-ACP methyl ester carboxylesterase
MKDQPLRLETNGSGDSVLFLHGAGVGGWSWTLQAEALPEFHCLAPDMPGHGLRARDSRFTVRGATEEMAELIRARGRNGKAHIVGLSLGAQVALQLAADHPHLVSSAFLSGALVLPRAKSPLSMLEPALGPFSTILLASYMPLRNFEFSIRSNMKASNIPERFIEPFKEDTRLRSLPGLLGVLEEYGRYRIPTSLPTSSTPILALSTENEPDLLDESARAIERTARNARAYRVSGAMHTWNLGNPGLFTATLRAWLMGVELPKAVSKLED